MSNRLEKQPKYKIGQEVIVKLKTIHEKSGKEFENELKGYIMSIIASGTSEKDTYEYEITERSEYPQIAYDFRPVISALCKLGDITGNKSYYKMGVNFYRWFLGSNPPGKIMYNPENGRCFDGINDQNNVNLNSGAESTIEALLSTLELQKRIFTAEEIKRIQK